MEVDHRMKGLDGLRGVAIVAVMLFHFLRSDRPTTAAAHLIVLAADHGWMGVDLFFVLSGFLITGILLRTRSDASYFKRFYARRVLRIFPAYYAVLVGVFLVAPCFVAVAATDARAIYAHQGWFWTYSANVFEAMQGGRYFQSRWLYLEHIWSLCVEEHFYLVWPLVVWWLPPPALLRVSIGTVVAVLLLRAALVSAGVDPWVVSTLTPCRVDSLLIGGVTAMVAREPGGLPRLTRAAPVVLATTGACLLAAVVARRTVLDKMHWTMQTWGYSVVALGSAALMVLAISPEPGPFRRLASGRVLAWFGKYSYGAYLLHHLMVPAVLRWLPFKPLALAAGSELAAVAIHAVAGITGAMVAATLSYHVLERHFLALKRHVSYDDRPPLRVNDGLKRPVS